MIRRLRGAGGTLLMLGFIAIYLSVMASLAITVDRRFFFNDGVAISVWVILGVILALAGRSLAKNR